MKHDVKVVPAEVTRLSIVEAAVVAAGFEYRRVEWPSECPPCFSRPLASYAISFDAFAPDELGREFLAPLMPRLARSSGTEAVEIERGKFIALETYRRIISMFCVDVLRNPVLAVRCCTAKDLTEATTQCYEMGIVGLCCVPVRATLLIGQNHWRIEALRSAYVALAYAGASYPEIAARGACDAVMRCCYRGRAPRRRKYFAAGAQILDEAIGLGARA